jgi:TM2 domain-containing membrane protein YozV
MKGRTSTPIPIMLFSSPGKDRAVTIVLALAGFLIPGLHKFYLGQWGWGWCYFLPSLMFWDASMGLVPRIACLFEGTWLLLLGQTEFDRRFNPGLVPASSNTNSSELAQMKTQQVENLGQSLRQLDQLRQEGLITEYEFEQQRRQLIQN